MGDKVQTETAPGDETEITPEMIAAGTQELLGFDRDRDTGAEIVRKIYLAMRDTRRGAS